MFAKYFCVSNTELFYHMASCSLYSIFSHHIWCLICLLHRSTRSADGRIVYRLKRKRKKRTPVTIHKLLWVSRFTKPCKSHFPSRPKSSLSRSREFTVTIYLCRHWRVLSKYRAISYKALTCSLNVKLHKILSRLDLLDKKERQLVWVHLFHKGLNPSYHLTPTSKMR